MNAPWLRRLQLVGNRSRRWPVPPVACTAQNTCSCLYLYIFCSPDLFPLLLFTPLATTHFFLCPFNQSIHALTHLFIYALIIKGQSFGIYCG